MKLYKFFSPKNIITSLRAEKKEKALKEILETLMNRNVLPREYVRAAYRAVLKREKLGSTGIGRGIAIPHAKLKSLDGIIPALARSEEGIEFHSVDGEKVSLLFFVLSPPKEEGLHLELLRWVSDIARDNDYCRFLREAKGSHEILSILREAEETILE